MKRKVSFKNMMIYGITFAAFGVLAASAFTNTIWPMRTFWASMLAVEWIALVGYANGFFILDEEEIEDE